MKLGTYRLRKSAERRILGASGPAARLWRHPWPPAAPWRRAAIDVVRDRGLGDVLLCTPALRAAKRANPALAIRFYTDFPELLRGLPYLDQVRPSAEAPPGAITLGYEDALPPRVHLARILGDVLGVRVADVRPDCVIDPQAVARLRAAWGAGPNVVVLRRAGRWTPNKDWPMPSWNALLARLAHDCRVIEIGTAREAGETAPAANYLDLRGTTDAAALAAVMAASDLYVGPDSGPMHLAAAAGRPAVVIAGGYDAAANIAYPTSVILAQTPPCAPCWRRDPCPFGLPCLTAITVELVAEAVASALPAQE